MSEYLCVFNLTVLLCLCVCLRVFECVDLCLSVHLSATVFDCMNMCVCMCVTARVGLEDSGLAE